MDKIIKFNDMLLESKSGYFSFTYKDEPYKFEGKTKKGIFIDIVEWLYKNNYDFKSVKVFDSVPVGHRKDHYHNIGNSNRFIDINFIKQYQGLILMLSDFGINKESISFGEIDSLDTSDKTNNEKETIDEIEKIKIFSKNPFRQSICVLGESGAGKSTTIRHILEFEGHEFDQIIPSASTTGLLSQFSPSRSGYIQSRLGKLIVKAFNDPTTLYTAIFDECHKSNIIEMINDELLQAISTKRNMGRRFISLDDDTSELYKGVDFDRGNILIPDNFGFIFISSKPRIISNNTDFFNRVDLVVLTESDREMKTSDELLSKVLPEEEKMKLASTRND